MAYVADLHLHSRFSRACSQKLNIPTLSAWGKTKGINVLGTSDFLHPVWFIELKNQLKEDGSGFLIHDGSETKFVLSVEVASIYSHKGKGRRIHNVILLPDFASAERFQKELLSRHANLGSDGRPIVGISSKDLLSIVLQISEKAIFIPAHAWTPWFGIFGSESGYDSLEECFEDLTEYIYGIETGLSSDPAMNWRIKELDNRSIISCSDAHSLPNLGREATVFDERLEQGYQGLFEAIKNQKIAGTIEFHPEEGKYHYTGHRNCNIKYSPEETKVKGAICPKCGRGLTVGVMERVEKLALRSNEELRIDNVKGIIKSKAFPEKAGYRMLVPLLQIIAESFNTAPTTQKVLNEYEKLTDLLGGEIKILTKVDTGEIAKVSGSKIAEGVDKVRRGDLVIDPGYDGVYGVVKIWGSEAGPKEEETPQLELFD
ncbi:MAG: endonuclease Q family protein [Candidatus Daviesbacteria bacterium]|nr:endonuclease Q family protein [Candidatus Daviesbacteria bacterium]